MDIRIDPLGYKRLLRERRASYEPLFASGVWRLRELLPAIDSSAIVSLAEGNMPLYESRSGATYAGVDRLAYLHLGMNPTGSFKDLGMTVAISAAKAAGARGVVAASTGNTASSMAAYAARAGLEAHAVVPRGRVSDAKLGQMLEYGATIVEVDGSFDDAFAQLDRLSEGALAIVNSTNPMRLQGQKCAAFSILEQRAWRVPDWVVLPGGNFGNISALGLGFREARDLGLIDRLPRIALVRAAAGVDTRASAIAVGDPKSRHLALHELQVSDGIMLEASDDAIFEAKQCIGREGIGCEPASAASLAGLRILRRRAIVKPESDVVALLTGHVLKDVGAPRYAVV